MSNIMWRPGYKFQLATTYVSRINRVDVWDIPQYWTPLACEPAVVLRDVQIEI